MKVKVIEEDVFEMLPYRIQVEYNLTQEEKERMDSIIHHYTVEVYQENCKEAIDIDEQYSREYVMNECLQLLRDKLHKEGKWHLEVWYEEEETNAIYERRYGTF